VSALRHLLLRPVGLPLVLVMLACAGAVADVSLKGVEDPLRSNVLAHLRLDDESCDEPESVIRYRFGAAETQIGDALKPYGYYSPTIEGSLDFPADACWQAVFRITPGAPVIIRRVNVRLLGDGDSSRVLQGIIAETKLEVGKPLNHAEYDTTKTRLAVTARERGYFDASFSSSDLTINPDTRSAEIDLILDTGPRYHFGKLSIDSSTLSEAFIRRYLTFAEGAPFEQSALRKLQTDLVRGEYFSNVDISLTRNPDNSVDVHLKLTEGRRIRYGIGLGYGTDTGPVIRADWVNRWVNHRGHRLEFDTELSPVTRSATVDYRIPSKRPQRDWYSLYGGYSWRDTDAVESKARKVGLREERFHTSRWRSNRFVEYLIEEFRQDLEWEERQSLVPGYALTYLYANSTERPTQGLRLSAEVLGASTVALSDVSFGRLKLSGKTILPLTTKSRLLLRGDIGWMATEDFDRTPPTYRFYAGGDRSVRGYAYQSLGPQDLDGNSIGGRRLLTGSVEIDHRLTDHWSVALFTDAGNVGKDNLQRDLPWSVGAGIRWYSPIGPIRLDFAFPQQGNDSFRIHISMGPDL